MANIKLIDAQGDERTYNGVAKVKIPLADGTGNATFIQPAGKKELTDTNEADVTNFATAQVVDENLVAENIKSGVMVLGIVGTHEGGSVEETPEWDGSFSESPDTEIVGGGSSDLLAQVIARTATEISDDSVTSIGDNAFRYYTDLIRVSFPNATTVGRYAFDYCENLASIDLPRVTSIGYGAFESNVYMLAELYLPSATSIGERAFIGCQGLTSIDLPCVTSIGDGAFYNSYNLMSVTIRTPSVCSLGTEAFDEMAMWMGLCIYVPANLVDAYKSATNWSAYADVIMPIEE